MGDEAALRLQNRGMHHEADEHHEADVPQDAAEQHEHAEQHEVAEHHEAAEQQVPAEQHDSEELHGPAEHQEGAVQHGAAEHPFSHDEMFLCLDDVFKRLRGEMCGLIPMPLLKSCRESEENFDLMAAHFQGAYLAELNKTFELLL